MDKKQVYQTDTEVDQFEISTTSNDTILDNSQNEKEKKEDRCIHFMIIIGFLIFVIAAVDTFALFFIPYNKYKENKKNFKDAQFPEISKKKIVIHFILNGLISLYGFGLFFPLCMNGCYFLMVIGNFCLPIIFFAYLAENAFNNDIDFHHFDLLIDDLIKLINNNPPIDFIRVNYQNSFSFENINFKTFDNSVYKNIVVPVSTNLSSDVFTFSDFPDVFYIQINQEIKMSNKMSSFFVNVLNVSNNTGSFISRRYLVSKHKKVSYLSESTKDWSHLFGVGIYYHIYSKSVPIMSKKVCLNADLLPDFNYSSIM